MSKNIKRDYKGSPIVEGAITYSKYDAKPKCKCNNTSNIKNNANRRLLFLMKNSCLINKQSKYIEPLIMTKSQQKYMEFQIEYSNSPKVIQFAYHNNRLLDFCKELEDLEKSNNKRKIKLLKSAIEMSITEEKDRLKELLYEICNDKFIIKNGVITND